MIEVPPKIWCPKVTSKYKCPTVRDTSVDNILDYGKFGQCLYKPKLRWDDGPERMNIILFDKMSHAKELNGDLSFNDAIDKESKAEIVSIIKQYWDYFAKEGAV